MSSKFDSVFLNGTSLRPAPFVNTSYEYTKAGEHTIGGFLIVTLSGTLVDKNIKQKIAELNTYQTNYSCINLMIGCSGGSDFLNGNGRIRSVDITMGDQPYTANYTIQIAIETVDGSPAVNPDPDFLRQTCITKALFLLEYDENIQIIGEVNNLGSVDQIMGVSKSYIKISGRLNVASYGRDVCGIPSYNGIQNSIDIIKERAKALMALNACDSSHPIGKYSGWSKWLDTKSLDINTGNGLVSWSFDMYVSQGSCAPYAFVDINTEDKKDQVKNQRFRNISGTIKGLSSATTDILDNKSCTEERYANALQALNQLQPLLINGTWPSSDFVALNGIAGNCVLTLNPCPSSGFQYCYQRISSSLNKSPVNGEITFSAQFDDINSCDPVGDGSIELSVDESLPVYRAIEIPIPYSNKAIVQVVADTPHRATVTIRGSLKNCDTTKMPTLIECVDNYWLTAIAPYNSWWQLKNKRTEGKYTYSKTTEFIKCG
jgi:hypothetical protein